MITDTETIAVKLGGIFVDGYMLRLSDSGFTVADGTLVPLGSSNVVVGTQTVGYTLSDATTMATKILHLIWLA